MNSNKNFAVFIITNGRPDRVITYETLRRCGYTGRIIIFIDDLDPSGPAYKEKYGDQVVVFDKRAIAKTFDRGDNFDNLRSTNYARNATFEHAKRLGIRDFIQLDDDYTTFGFRFDDRLDYNYATMKNLDRVFDSLVKFFRASGASSIALAQGGDFMGGSESQYAGAPMVLRKAMNSFICATDRPFTFIGRLNEDVNTYVRLGAVGQLFFTLNQVSLAQVQTQAQAGGMTAAYLESGTYVKSFYSVMYAPSAVKVAMLHSKNSRIHHRVFWKNAAPKIVREELKK